MLRCEEKGDSRLSRLETNEVEDNGLSVAVVPLRAARRPTHPCALNAWVGLDHVAAAAAASTTSSASTINTKAPTKCGRLGGWGKKEFPQVLEAFCYIFFSVGRPRSVARCVSQHTRNLQHIKQHRRRFG